MPATGVFMTKRNLNGFLHLAHAREREKPANPPDPPEPGDDKLARLPEPDSDDRQGRVYRAPSEAGPGNDINAGSPGFQKAPTRGPASLVAVRALAARRPACDTAIVGHRNFAIEHDLACVPGPCRGAIHQDSAAQQHQAATVGLNRGPVLATRMSTDSPVGCQKPRR